METTVWLVAIPKILTFSSPEVVVRQKQETNKIKVKKEVWLAPTQRYGGRSQA